MGDFLTHECGLALVRLRKPIAHYQERYGDPLWGMRRLYLLMEKQHNRGQDGAGIATARFDMASGEPFLTRARSAERNPVERLFDEALEPVRHKPTSELCQMSTASLKQQLPLLGEAMIGHLRYGTHGGRTIDACHPYLRRSNIASRNLALAGNFNLTNSHELFQTLVEYGLNPVGESDTGVVLEKIGHNLDREHHLLHASMGPGSFANLEGRCLAEEVSKQLDYERIIRRAAEQFDGGWVLVGLVGNGDCFACRDVHGIRPAYMLVTEDVVAVASERPALAGVFDVDADLVKPLPAGHVLSVKRDGTVSLDRVADEVPLRQCSFERIYFSRGNDHEIYQERKDLGRNLAAPILTRLGGSLEKAVFSFIPNTSESAYIGLVEECDRLVRESSGRALWELVQAGRATQRDIERLADIRVRAEKVAHKDQRLRTFITHDSARKDLVRHVYDITRGVVRQDDTLVVIDDSIVRGTTLRDSIITILSRLHPQRIIVASSAPPIMYPDCYGIDMSQLGRFIAFEAAVGLVRQRGDSAVLEEIEARCLEQETWPVERIRNHVALLYETAGLDRIPGEVSRLVTAGASGPAVEVIYQSVDGLRRAMPFHTGDWYFTGDYPTPGGYRVLNRAYLNWRRGDDSRAY
ncbi:MAG: amidophosphoribosyltransferase [Phycisphaerales bacterium]|nr:amidophosphoribosyltransferase [Phycisphaerales bacterium]